MKIFFLLKVSIISVILIFLYSYAGTLDLEIQNIRETNKAGASEEEENIVENKSIIKAGNIGKKANKYILFKTNTITLNFAGDVTIGQDESFGYENSFMQKLEEQNNDYGYFFKGVKDIFKKDDLTIVNLETNFTNNSEKTSKKYRFKAEPALVDILKQGSIEVVNIANNHMHDYKVEGYQDTISTLKEEKIKFYGSDIFEVYNNNYNAGLLNYDFPLIVDIRGFKIGLLGYKGWSIRGNIKDIIKEDIEKMKEKCNYTIVTFHWGDEGKFYPNVEQKELAHLCIDNGADIVLGHHPHVLQGVETYKNKKIVYSLGSFCFGGNRNLPDKDTMIYQVKIDVDSNNNKVMNEEYKIIPCSVSSVDNLNDYQPTILEGQDYDRVMDRIKEYSENIN